MIAPEQTKQICACEFDNTTIVVNETIVSANVIYEPIVRACTVYVNDRIERIECELW